MADKKSNKKDKSHKAKIEVQTVNLSKQLNTRLKAFAKVHEYKSAARAIEALLDSYD